MSDHEPLSSRQEERLQDLELELRQELRYRKKRLPNYESGLSQEQFLKRLKYDEEFLELLCPRSSSGRLLFTFIARNLRAFHIQLLYNEAYILNESYMRGAILIQQGGEIHNLPAWLKQTSYNIIRELHREQKRTQPLDDYLLDTQVNPIAPESIETELILLSRAFKLLEPKDQMLLELKINQRLSWKDIHLIFKREGVGNFTEQALRKRKERALIRLRKAYHSITPSEHP